MYGSNICWAATIACINNYVHGTSLTAIQVAKTYYGENYNKSFSTSSSAGVMRAHYNLLYQYYARVPSSNIILSNIQSGYPIYGRFVHSSGGHAVTIYGVNLISGYITVMDPEFGSTICYYSNGIYSYTGRSGAKLKLTEAICYIW